MIYGARIRQARELREVLQRDLADLMGITGGRLAQIEASVDPVRLDEAQISQLSAALRMPASFFEVPLGNGIPEGSMRYRARKTVTKRALNKARREAELAHEIVTSCLAKVDVPVARIPAVAAAASAEEAAQDARSSLGLPPLEPIPNVMRALERAGVWMLSIDSRIDGKLDAFSFWVGDALERPVIVFGEGMSWDRLRFTIAHELGHFVRHRAAIDDGSDGVTIERQADQFASAFLFPAEAALEELPRPLTLGQLLPLKQKWGVSVASLVTRARTLDVITQAQYFSLHKQIGARRWKTQEPGSDLRFPERPRAVKKMLELAYGTPLDVRQIADAVGRYPSEVGRELERYGTVATDRRSMRNLHEVPAGNVVDFAARRARG